MIAGEISMRSVLIRRMTKWWAPVVIVVAVGSAVMWLDTRPTMGQAATYRAPRTPDGRPDLNGLWQAVNAANWDLEDHEPRPSPLPALGARGAIPAGSSVVVGGPIPYKPEARAQKDKNLAQWSVLDPTVKCFLPGIPRSTYMPFPFQIVQGIGADILFAYEFADAMRIVRMNNSPLESPAESWMGWSKGKWDGETLVIEVIDFNDQTWFDSAGNYHSEQLRVTERYTPTGPDHLLYEATITDPKVFTRPWTIRMPLYRRVEENARLHEFKCVEFAEEVMYRPPAEEERLGTSVATGLFQQTLPSWGLGLRLQMGP